MSEAKKKEFEQENKKLWKQEQSNDENCGSMITDV